MNVSSHEARAKFHLNDLVAARDIAARVLMERPRWLTAQTTLVAALWNLGSEDEARDRQGNTAQPSQLDRKPLGSGIALPPPDLDALITPLRLAGLPD